MSGALSFYVLLVVLLMSARFQCAAGCFQEDLHNIKRTDVFILCKKWMLGFLIYLLLMLNKHFFMSKLYCAKSVLL